eukprot:8835470-Heterocapsa_arctica.AAC.1
MCRSPRCCGAHSRLLVLLIVQLKCMVSFAELQVVGCPSRCRNKLGTQPYWGSVSRAASVNSDIIYSQFRIVL